MTSSESQCRRLASRKNPRFIADLTGNKAGDIVGFGNNGVHLANNMVTARSSQKRRLSMTSLTMLVT
jgi:hypothetical protein